MSRRPSSWSKLSTIVERPGQPVALIPRKRGISCVRASVLPSLKNRDTFADTSRATLSCTGGDAYGYNLPLITHTLAKKALKLVFSSPS